MPIPLRERVLLAHLGTNYIIQSKFAIINIFRVIGDDRDVGEREHMDKREREGVIA